MLKSFANLFRDKTEARRLTFSQARSIGNDAAKKAGLNRELGMVAKTIVNGRPAWHVSTATIGSGYGVTIDDQTGDASDIERWGVR